MPTKKKTEEEKDEPFADASGHVEVITSAYVEKTRLKEVLTHAPQLIGREFNQYHKFLAELRGLVE